MKPEALSRFFQKLVERETIPGELLNADQGARIIAVTMYVIGVVTDPRWTPLFEQIQSDLEPRPAERIN